MHVGSGNDKKSAEICCFRCDCFGFSNFQVKINKISHAISHILSYFVIIAFSFFGALVGLQFISRLLQRKHIIYKNVVFIKSILVYDQHYNFCMESRCVRRGYAAIRYKQRKLHDCSCIRFLCSSVFNT